MNKKLRKQAIRKLKLHMFRNFSFESARFDLMSNVDGCGAKEADMLLNEFGDWLQRRINKLEGW